MPLSKVNEVLKGSKGSGDWGHTGRPGKRGGSGGGKGKGGNRGFSKGDEVSFIEHDILGGPDKKITGTYIGQSPKDKLLSIISVGGNNLRSLTSKLSRVDFTSLPELEKGKPAPKVEGKPASRSTVRKQMSSKDMDKLSKSWEKKLSDDEKGVITEYSDGLYNVLNSNLRNVRSDRDPVGYDKELSLEIVGGVDNAIKTMDSIMSKAPPLPNELTVYRSIPKKALAGKGKGSAFNDKGYSSTSLSKGLVTDEFLFSDRVLTEIRLPKGTRGTYLRNTSLGPNEQEYLLPRNSKFKIVSRSKDGVILELM